ncbi:GDSL-type esterase/lipase family protein [Bacteroides caecimuris]|jgi:lysophospholipase L1-like esterase|uniref:GDSL-type esterase/lipase family protein n=1 Tax=Bacteroides caecimuris TaxID=1796613 RepID=UPI002659BCDE|nr:GDSL-type esterase/lipase family protein [Bacteroides caecimuris]
MKWLKPILFAFIFFNPIALLILFKSYWVSLLVPFIIVLGGYYVCKIKNLRWVVWLFNIFAIIGISLNAELVFRSLYADKGVPNIYEVRGKYYFNKPYLNQKFDDEEFNSRYLTNCQGYRIDLLSNANDSITQCDWLFLGDSFTQGAQVNYDEMFSSLLYHDFPDKIIVNAGMSGAGLYESLNYLKDEGVSLRPKRIILQIGAFNDFYNIREREAGWSEYLLEHSELYRYIQYNLIDNPVLPLGRWTEPFFDNKEENLKYNIFFKESSSEKEADKTAFVEVLSKLKKEADEINAELVVMLIPSKEQTSDEMLNEVCDRFGINKAELDMIATNRLVKEACNRLGIGLIDLYDSFRQSDKFPFFHRDEHLNSDGHRLIASVLKSAFAAERSKYNVFSIGNKNDRYPTFFDDGMSILFQSQEDETYLIKASNLIHSREDIVWSSPKELIHPIISKGGTRLAFTQGDQDRGETDVILYNRETGTDCRVNPDGYRGAIPTFSNDSRFIVYPKWRDNENPVICIYDISKKKEVLSIGDKKAECWRPIFAPNDSIIYYIRMESDGLFGIRSFNISTREDRKILKITYNIWDIAVSPNGEKIVYAGNKDGNWDLFILDIASKKISQITQTIGNEWDPVFYNDDEIWFAGEFGINNGIYHLRLK